MDPTSQQRPRKPGRPAGTGPGSRGGRGLSLKEIAPRWRSIIQWARSHGRERSWGYKQVDAGNVGYDVVNGEKRISDEHDAAFIKRFYSTVPAAPRPSTPEAAAIERATAAITAEVERRLAAKRQER